MKAVELIEIAAFTMRDSVDREAVAAIAICAAVVRARKPIKEIS